MRRLFLAAFLATPAFADPARLELHLSFEPGALSALLQRGEAVTVAAYFSGEPSASNRLALNEIGLVDLGREEITVRPGDRILTLGQSLDGAPLDAVVEPFVNVNVFTARLSDAHNLIDCGFLDAPLAELAAAPQQLRCRLIAP